MTSQEPRTAPSGPEMREWVRQTLLDAGFSIQVGDDSRVNLVADRVNMARVLDRLDGAEAANGSALDVERLARALADQHLAWPKHWRDEDNLRWLARQIAAEYARLTSSPDPAALADRLVEEGRVSVWGRPGTKFTAKRAKAPEATDG